MAFKIVSQPKAWWPVIFKGVTEDGTIVENTFDGRFRILDEDENLELEREIAKIRAAEDAEAKSLSEVLAPLIMKFLEDWRGVTEDDGTDAGVSLPFTPENLMRMLRVPNVSGAIATAYRAARAGEPETRKGN